MRLVARLPRSVHRELQRRAAREGVSINTMLETVAQKALLKKSVLFAVAEEAHGARVG